MPFSFRGSGVGKVQSKRLNDRLEGLIHRGQDWKPFWPVAQVILHRSVVTNFRRGGRPNRWKKLSAWTLKVRRGRGAVGNSPLSQNVLMDQGTLFQSIGTVNVTTKQTMRYGTNLRYAKLQNYGSAGLPGGVLKPKSSKYLALPFPGVRGRPRDYKDTFVVTTARSKTIWQKLSGSGSKPLFLLKKSVRIPARPFILFQKEDVDKLLSMAKVYVMDPKRFTAGGGK